MSPGARVCSESSEGDFLALAIDPHSISYGEQVPAGVGSRWSREGGVGSGEVTQINPSSQSPSLEGQERLG